MRVFITGGTGLVGKLLVKRLLERGDQAVVLSRRPDAARSELPAGAEIVSGDPMHSGPWQEKLAECDAVVHLAGENVFARRWSAAFKEMLWKSRVDGTRNVAEAIKPGGKVRTLVAASAIGLYGPRGDEELDENSAPGSDFLAQLCVEWEKSAASVRERGVRLVNVRVGVVLDRNGGAIGKMLTPFKMFVGGPIGSGRQWMSWIHNEDLVGMILFALDRSEATGPLNGTAPNPVTNKDFSKALGRVLHRPSFMKTPGFMLRVMLGEVAGVITTGQRVLPRKAMELGYAFKFRELDAALRDLFPST